MATGGSVALDVTALSLAGAFVIGTIAGAIATIRLTKSLVELAARARRRMDRDDSDDPI